MLNSKVNDALNQQINLELFSSYSYLAMAAYFEEEELAGFASWFRIQAEEEHGHAMKFLNYVTEACGHAELLAIAAPKSKFKDALDVFKQGLEHEKRVSASLNKLMDVAQKEKDYATATLLQWFISEQVEEEASFTAAIRKLETAGCSSGLLFLDHHFGKRTAAK